MSSNMIAALFSDVDRTLLTSDYRLPAAVVERFAILGQKAHLVLATARSPGGVRPICEALGVRYAICFNGGWIGEPATMTSISQVLLSRELALSIMSSTRALGISSLWYGAGGIWTLELDDLVMQEARITGEQVKHVARLEDLPDQPFKIMCSRPAPDGEGFDQLRALYSNECDVSASNWRLLELTPASVSKGRAASLLAGYLNVSAADCAAAGDAENDLSLLRWAGTPVTVANAIPECIDMARFVGPAADEGGMAQVLDWLLAAR